MTCVFMFPGQSSRYSGMLDRIADVWPKARDVIAGASELLGRDLAHLFREGDDSAFDKNRNVQVGVFLTSHLHLSALRAMGIDAPVSMGLSLGEFNHLVHIGALDFDSALRLVDARGKVYDKGPRGMMAALFPVDSDLVDELLEKARPKGIIEVANINSPSQFVVAGARAAVEEAMRIADEEFSVHPAVIEQHIPMHSSVFTPVSDSLRPYLKAAPWKKPKLPYLSNVLGGFVDNPNAETIQELLARHVHSPVRWREQIDAVAARYEDAVFVEVGPRSVLFNLLQKRWRRNTKFKTDSGVDFADGFRNLVHNLQNLGRPVEFAAQEA